MAEAAPTEPAKEELRFKGTFAGQAVDLAAKGSTIIILLVVAAVGVLALREHARRESAEQRIETLLKQQNKLLHDQTDDLREEIDDVQVSRRHYWHLPHQFPRGAIEWDLLPAHLHGCYPEYVKKVPRQMNDAIRKHIDKAYDEAIYKMISRALEPGMESPRQNLKANMDQLLRWKQQIELDLEDI